MTLSAKGTRLNRRGLETRSQLLAVALTCLASGRPESVSANYVARTAGVTWGTVQHQFGDTDGLWAAVLAGVVEKFAPTASPNDSATDAQPDPPIAPRAGGEHRVGRRVADIVSMLWDAVDRPESHAVYNLRLSLPRERGELEATYPRTAAALAACDAQWTATCQRAFDGLPVEPDQLRKVVALLPGALMGLRHEQSLVTYASVNDGLEGLTEAIQAYLT